MRGDVVRGRPDRQRVVVVRDLAGEVVDLGDRLDLVAEELDAHRAVGVRREDVDDVAAHAERAAREVEVVAVVLDVDEVADELVAVVGAVRP